MCVCAYNNCNSHLLMEGIDNFNVVCGPDDFCWNLTLPPPKDGGTTAVVTTTITWRYTPGLQPVNNLLSSLLL